MWEKIRPKKINKKKGRAPETIKDIQETFESQIFSINADLINAQLMLKCGGFILTRSQKDTSSLSTSY